ncbi:hypothetical protein PoB_006425800 [Plakobranchus ocellatus]|uniref:Uncharacterized protein n=1 Tax=Plakobranchus ocellatus TaxID=259542 RepID=A0AAV4D0N9_9GAST|nr:hypothetical protein PoB_006425800 [Plakobranchus ocellatus]
MKEKSKNIHTHTHRQPPNNTTTNNDDNNDEDEDEYSTSNKAIQKQYLIVHCSTDKSLPQWKPYRRDRSLNNFALNRSLQCIISARRNFYQRSIGPSIPDIPYNHRDE